MREYSRPPVVAGTWYPGDASNLRQTIRTFFKEVPERDIVGEIIGLISPHAGFPYSGKIAAHGYKLLQGSEIDRVILLSPFHRGIGEGIAVADVSSYETPLGRVMVDVDAIDSIERNVRMMKIRHDQEHAIEIQLPFLQMCLKDFTLIPIMFAFSSTDEKDAIVRSLVDIMGNRGTVIVASSDLHHISDYREVKRRDEHLIQALKTYDMERIIPILEEEDCSVCGKVPIVIAMEVAKQLGAERIEILENMNSGDITGEKRRGQYTVGYLSAALLKVH